MGLDRSVRQGGRQAGKPHGGRGCVRARVRCACARVWEKARARERARGYGRRARTPCARLPPSRGACPLAARGAAPRTPARTHATRARDATPDAHARTIGASTAAGARQRDQPTAGTHACAADTRTPQQQQQPRRGERAGEVAQKLTAQRAGEASARAGLRSASDQTRQGTAKARPWLSQARPRPSKARRWQGDGKARADAGRGRRRVWSAGPRGVRQRRRACLQKFLLRGRVHVVADARRLRTQREKQTDSQRASQRVSA
jgi:hypothetical protein